jgi:peptidyl-prolyl cis-trans isomerase A (cyclophilin A)
MRKLSLFLLVSTLALAQSSSTSTKSATKTGAAHRAAARVDPTQTFPTEPGLYVALNTTQGRIVCKLFEKEAPITVKNFVALATGKKPWTDPKTGKQVLRPYYNGISFHRVIPGFMIQGGDPTGTGMGNGGVATIPDEFDPSLTFEQNGRLAMANTGQPHTGATQFFITDSTPTYLNGKHTIFGQVVTGQDIVTKITQVPRDSNDKPNTPVVMTSVVIRRVGPAPATATPVHKTVPKKS